MSIIFKQNVFLGHTQGILNEIANDGHKCTCKSSYDYQGSFEYNYFVYIVYKIRLTHCDCDDISDLFKDKLVHLELTR